MLLAQITKSKKLGAINMIKVKKCIFDLIIYFFALLGARYFIDYIFSDELTREHWSVLIWALIAAIFLSVLIPKYTSFMNKKYSSPKSD